MYQYSTCNIEELHNYVQIYRFARFWRSNKCNGFLWLNVKGDAFQQGILPRKGIPKMYLNV